MATKTDLITMLSLSVFMGGLFSAGGLPSQLRSQQLVRRRARRRRAWSHMRPLLPSAGALPTFVTGDLASEQPLGLYLPPVSIQAGTLIQNR